MSFPLRRRQFLGGSAAAVVAAATAQQQAVSQDSAAGWIDAHVHVWSPDTQQYPISPNFQISDMAPRSFTADELWAHARPAGVERIVLIQMSFYEWDHTYMRQVMRSAPQIFAGVALIDHRSEQVERMVDMLAAAGMRGFRLHSRGDAQDWPTSPTMAKLWKKCAADNLAVCPLINPADIPHVASLCQRFPETTVVVDHFARVGISGKIEPQELTRLCDLAKYPNVHVKTSAFYALGKKTAPYDDLIPMIRRVVDAFGPQRLMWASDCPYQVQGEHTYEASLALIRDRIDFLSDEDKRWMLRGTAERVFFA